MKTRILIVLVIALLLIAAVPPPPGPDTDIHEAIVWLLGLVGGIIGSSVVQWFKKLILGDPEGKDERLYELLAQLIVIAIAAVVALIELFATGWITSAQVSWENFTEVAAVVFSMAQVWYTAMLKPAARKKELANG